MSDYLHFDERTKDIRLGYFFAFQMQLELDCAQQQLALSKLKEVNSRIEAFLRFSSARWANHKKLKSLAKDMAELRKLLDLIHFRVRKLKGKLGLKTDYEDE